MSIKGFYAQKEEKKRGKGERRWEKPTFLRELSRSKELYSPRPLSRGITTQQNPEKSLRTGSQFCSLKEEDEQLGLQKRDTWSVKMEAPTCNRRRRHLQTGAPAWASVPNGSSKTCFPLTCSKVCIHSHEAQTIRQQHDTINQNQTANRVFVGTQQTLQCA